MHFHISTMDTRGGATLVFLCSYGVGAYGSVNVAFSGTFAELDGNLTTCKNTTTNQTSYTYMYTLLLAADYVISRINIDYRYGQTDELSGFSLFLGPNCSDLGLSLVYQHMGPVIPSSRVSLTFPANAPKVASCIGYRNNRTMNNVPTGYSAGAKVDICNLEVLGCRQGFYGNYCSYPCPPVCENMCNPDSGKCLNDVSAMDQEYIEVLCPDPGYLQQSISLICVEETPSSPSISVTHYSSSNTTAVCPPRLYPLTSPCLGSPSVVDFCADGADMCTIDSGDVLNQSLVTCSGSEVALKLHYRCNKVCPVTATEKLVPFAVLQEANQSGALVLHYQCNPGYFSSILNVYCDRETLVWLSPFPKCKKSCALTGADQNVSNADWWSNDTHLVYSCHAGYSLQGGNLMRNCTPSGQWSGHPPNCKEITCPCLCDLPWLDPSTLNGSEALMQRIEEIKSSLTVNIRTTSKFNRSRKSAPDPRPSARGIGFGVGVTILVIIVGLICIPDIPKLVQDIKFGCS